MKLLFLDTETTNLKDDRLIQLACGSKKNPHDVLNIHCSYFRPPEPIDFEAMAVHHITNEMVLDKPYFSESELKKDLENMRVDHVFIAHNAPFDLAVLAREGISFPLWIDTKRVAMHLFDSKSYRLQFLRYSLSLNVEGMAHDAAGDVAVLEKLFSYLYRLVEQRLQNSDFEAIINHMMALSVNPVLMKEIPFGKHKGKTFEEIAQYHRDYLTWLWNETMKKSDEEKKNDEDLIYTLKFYLNHA